ncbi:MAG: DUF3243 family protein [Firmicutes bacterium]|nr:DUF3243 family protein [Bacillota bacterium]
MQERIDSFEEFKHEMAQRIEVAEEIGLSPKMIRRQAARVGDWLAEHYDVQSPEQRLLKELWEAADEKEQEAIASAMTKMVQRTAS